MSYDNTNSGTLGKNRYKDNEKKPDVTGMVKELDDEALRLIQLTRTIPLSYWTKTSQSGEKFMSGGVDMYRLRKLAAENEAPPQAPARPQSSGAALDDEIPFSCERSWP